MARCRWRVQDGVRFHVPECWGTVHDPDGACNCPRAEVTLEDRFEELSAQVAKLAARIDTQALRDLPMKGPEDGISVD